MFSPVISLSCHSIQILLPGLLVRFLLTCICCSKYGSLPVHGGRLSTTGLNKFVEMVQS